MYNITRMPPLSSNKAEPTLALKPRGDITRSLKQGSSGPTKRTHVLQNFFKKKFKKSCFKGIQHSSFFWFSGTSPGM